MKKIFKFYAAIVGILLCASSCKKSFDDLTINENVPLRVPASLLFKGILNSMVEAPDGKKEIYSQYYLYNYDYYGNNRYNFNDGDNYYTILKNVKAMEEEAIKVGSAPVNPYSAVGKFFRAYFFSKISMQVGDIPMTQSLQGIDNLKPAYDSQKTVMLQSLALLESANTDFTSLIATGGNTLNGDIYFGGSLAQWQKVVNTFKIRLLLQLSKKASDTDLNIPAQFAAIVNNPTKYPVMQTAADNLQYIYVEPTNLYPQTPNNFGNEGSRKNSSATYISLLTQLKDPRVFVTAEPARYLVDDLKQSPTAFNSFVGADAGLDLGVMYSNAGLQKYSFINRKRYYSTFTGEPSIQVGYAELMFNIAEGINRGWASGDAESYYTKGIQTSFQFYNIPTGTGTFTASFYRPGSSSTTNAANYDTYPIAVDWNTYYLQAAVKYTAGATGLTQILQQKYLALFRHSGLESYFTYRRTGIPTFTTGPGTGNSARIATRFKYSKEERSANTDNYNKALASQYGGTDDINGLMWILK
jgi:hypothetical protein